MNMSRMMKAPLAALVCALGAGAALSIAQARAPSTPFASADTPANDTVFDDGFGEPRDVVRARRGFALAPVPLDLVGSDPVQVGLGSYLVNAFNCSQCHTNPPFAVGGDPFMGQPKRVNAINYLAGGKQFGPVTSTNLTPSLATGLPGGLSFTEFEETMRHGTNLNCPPTRGPALDGAAACMPKLQEMPWPFYRQMSATDLAAIYAYLRVIPHAELGP